MVRRRITSKVEEVKPQSWTLYIIRTLVFALIIAGITTEFADLIVNIIKQG